MEPLSPTRLSSRTSFFTTLLKFKLQSIIILVLNRFPSTKFNYNKALPPDESSYSVLQLSTFCRPSTQQSSSTTSHPQAQDPIRQNSPLLRSTLNYAMAENNELPKTTAAPLPPSPPDPTKTCCCGRVFVPMWDDETLCTMCTKFAHLESFSPSI